MKKILFVFMMLVIAIPIFAADPDVDKYFSDGKAAFDMKKYDEAIKCFDKAIELDPKNVEAYKSRGSTKDFNEVIKLDPKDENAYCNRGFVKDDLKDYAGAIVDYDKVIELIPKSSAYVYYRRGISKYHLGDKRDALEDLKKAEDLGYTQASDKIKEIQGK
jgi:tetratricopeptide (TPR) repeat protein